MKFATLALTAALVLTAEGFSPAATNHGRSTTRLSSAVAPPQREAPGAGYVPEWEDRPGLSPEEFMASDMSKPDRSGMWECPLTRWDSDDIDVVKAQKEAAKMPKCPLEMRASAADNAKGAQYFADNKEKIRKELLKYGAVWLRGFDLMKSFKGHREMYEALGLDPCLDPLHSSGLRKFASERDAIYEEVNKPSLRGHYIGLHCESTTKRTAAYAAFVCLQKATEGGGRFLVADGAAILAELDTKLLQKLYDRKIRISVSNLDLPPSLPGILKEGVKGLVDAAVAPKFDMDLEMVFEADGKEGRLQAIETAEAPINRHPVTGLPVWFNNAHNHARKLRDRRPCGVPEVGMTEVFYADTLEPLSLEDCQEIKRASEKHITALAMEPGDVLLVDNYRALHGRDVFQGDRFHAVSWFTWDDKEEWRGNERRIVEKNALNQAINSMMDWLPKDFESNQS
ncbi:taurine catabolism dioxygenase taud tfda [Seminavis robusta]|uniref:Taurine catabolism dioxygenase taud tfda n=1 Tax=Seminavis robusta TaxID=568900 RepID=A0A9N8DW77_9STRA|nr:taurine catabolism dioxygenase taud tfda [Seminavis robusta]|eukprot:Sro404_g135960.1 taurine catabolism dioxygenase taud tfda (455) ;mRNA; r:50096-51755